MFKLLSKESNIFSIPVYIGFLIFMIFAFNIFDFNTLEIPSLLLTFCGIALGYFCFNAIGITRQTHLPLFLYTFFIFAFYPGHLDLGLSFSLLTNSFLILILTNIDEDFRKKSYVLVGSLLALNYIFLPATWPMAIFVILHIFATSSRIALHLFRLFFGALLIVISYFCIAYFFNLNQWNSLYFPLTAFAWNKDFHNLLYLSPIFILLCIAVFDHFANYNRKSPSSRFKYTFLLVFFLAQLITIFLYMGTSFEFLMLLSIPASIILSRLLRFSKMYWKQELGLWLIIGCLIAFKLTVFF